jgi:putative transposase
MAARPDERQRRRHAGRRVHARLGILHQTTRPYSPYQNAQQEVFWARVEGRLMAMLDGAVPLTLNLLNEATQAWIEHEYTRRAHGCGKILI